MKKSEDFRKLELDFKKLQKSIIEKLISMDSKAKIYKAKWQYKTGGGGLSCEVLGNNIIEKGMINFSSIKGKVLPNSALSKKIKGNVTEFVATGVSVVIQPNNPFTPCSHLNVRCFETNSSSKKNILEQDPITVTDIFISSIHFGYNLDKTPYIHLNDYPPSNNED